MKRRLTDWYSRLETTRADEVKLDFAIDLASAIEAAGISRQDFAARVGVSGARIAKALRGDANLTIESMDMLAAAAGLDMHIHLAQKGAKVRWFDVLSSTENSMQSTNAGSSYVTSVSLPITSQGQIETDDLIAL